MILPYRRLPSLPLNVHILRLAFQLTQSHVGMEINIEREHCGWEIMTLSTQGAYRAE